MHVGDTLIQVDIQAPNGHEIRDLVIETFKYMPPWKMVGNAFHAPSNARFFNFNLTTREFVWHRSNESFADTMDEDEFVIHDVAEMSWLLEFVFLNCDTMRQPHGLNLEKLKQKLDEFNKPPKKRKQKSKTTWGPTATDQDLIDALVAIQPMAYPSGKVFYMDYINTTGMPPEHLEVENEIAAKAKAKLKAMAVAGGHALKFPVETKIKMDGITKKMAAEVAAEIDEEILKKLMETVGQGNAAAATAAYPWHQTSWGAMAEQQALVQAAAQHEKSKLAKYAYKKFNPEFYGKITIQADPPYPTDF